MFQTGCTIFVSVLPLTTSLNDGYQIKATVDTIAKENEAFWVRFLKTDGDLLSVNTPSPTPEATCSVDVTLRCTTNDDIPCKDIKSPSSSSDEKCIQTINYSIDIMNSGTVNMDIKEVSFAFNGNVDELVKDLKETSLGPDKSTILLIEEEINVCTNDEFEASVAVTAQGHNGKECQDRDEYNFIVEAASTTPSPVAIPKKTSSPTLTEPVTTAEPTLSPVTQPTNVPTMAMSDIQSDLPSEMTASGVPTNQVASTSKPSFLIVDPTEPPTIAGNDVSSAPTSLCVIGVDLSCSVGSGPNAGKLCDTPGVEVQQCLERPTQSTMLYNGGNCDQSENRQLLKFTCTDFNGGPSLSGSAYIVVTDANGNGITYFEGSVNVSDNYILDNDGERFESDMIISIYDSAVATDTNLLQRVEYSSSCNTILEIHNRFGASQIVQFFNEIQGNVTSYIDASFQLSVQIPSRFDGDNATMQTLVSITNFAGTVNLTSRINGQTLSPGSNIAIFLNTTLDYSTRKRYTALTTASATSNPIGNLCKGSDFYAFQGMSFE